MLYFNSLLAFGQIPPAYLDPGTGSLIIQVLIGALVGGLVVAKIFWARTKIFFTNLFSSGSKHGKDKD